MKSLPTLVAGFVLVLAAAAFSPEAQAQPLGQATGRFTVDGKPFSFGYAYAHVEADSQGADRVWVLLTEKVVPPERLEARLREVVAGEQLNALVFALDEQNIPSDWRWHHPGLSIGCALCSDLRVKVSKRTGDQIAGTAFSLKRQSYEKQAYEFTATFSAPITRPAEPVAASPAAKAAIAKLRQRGLAFRPADFHAFGTDPEVVRLFLDAGMRPDVLAPGATDTVLLSALRTDCANDRVRAVALMLIAAGANPNYRSPDGNMPLSSASACADVADALLKAGARFDEPSPVEGESVGLTTMESAITFGHPEVVRVLIARGYDVKKDGARLLARAGSREPEVTKMLRAAGAVPATAARVPANAAPRATAPSAPAAAPAGTARTPEQAKQELARRKLAFTQEGFWDRLTEFDAAGSTLYLDAGMDPSARRSSDEPETPLLFVTNSGCAASGQAAEAIALALIARRADVTARDGNGTTPLIHAAERCPAAVVRALLRAGASTTAKSAGGATALMLAVLSDREDNVRALIDGGYDVASELSGLLPLAAGKPGIEALLKGAAKKRR